MNGRIDYMFGSSDDVFMDERNEKQITNFICQRVNLNDKTKQMKNEEQSLGQTRNFFVFHKIRNTRKIETLFSLKCPFHSHYNLRPTVFFLFKEKQDLYVAMIEL